MKHSLYASASGSSQGAPKKLKIKHERMSPAPPENGASSDHIVNIGYGAPATFSHLLTSARVSKDELLQQVNIWQERFSFDEQFRNGVKSLILSHYPVDNKMLLDNVLVTFLLFNPIHCETLLAPLIESMLANNVEYNKKVAPFYAFLNVFTRLSQEPAESNHLTDTPVGFCMEFLLLLTVYLLSLPKSENHHPAAAVDDEEGEAYSAPSPMLRAWLTDCLLEAPKSLRDTYVRKRLLHVDTPLEAPRAHVRVRAHELLLALVDDEHQRSEPPSRHLLHAAVPVLLRRAVATTTAAASSTRTSTSSSSSSSVSVTPAAATAVVSNGGSGAVSFLHQRGSPLRTLVLMYFADDAPTHVAHTRKVLSELLTNSNAPRMLSTLVALLRVEPTTSAWLHTHLLVPLLQGMQDGAPAADQLMSEILAHPVDSASLLGDVHTNEDTSSEDTGGAALVSFVAQLQNYTERVQRRVLELWARSWHTAATASHHSNHVAPASAAASSSSSTVPWKRVWVLVQLHDLLTASLRPTVLQLFATLLAGADWDLFGRLSRCFVLQTRSDPATRVELFTVFLRAALAHAAGGDDAQHAPPVLVQLLQRHLRVLLSLEAPRSCVSTTAAAAVAPMTTTAQQPFWHSSTKDVLGVLVRLLDPASASSLSISTSTSVSISVPASISTSMSTAAADEPVRVLLRAVVSGLAGGLLALLGSRDADVRTAALTLLPHLPAARVWSAEEVDSMLAGLREDLTRAAEQTEALLLEFTHKSSTFARTAVPLVWQRLIRSDTSPMLGSRLIRILESLLHAAPDQREYLLARVHVQLFTNPSSGRPAVPFSEVHSAFMIAPALSSWSHPHPLLLALLERLVALTPPPLLREHALVQTLTQALDWSALYPEEVQMHQCKLLALCFDAAHPQLFLQLAERQLAALVSMLAAASRTLRDLSITLLRWYIESEPLHTSAKTTHPRHHNREQVLRLVEHRRAHISTDRRIADVQAVFFQQALQTLSDVR